jgi:hypothetical protein
MQSLICPDASSVGEEILSSLFRDVSTHMRSEQDANKKKKNKRTVAVTNRKDVRRAKQVNVNERQNH